ncbi:hypothetical protein PDE_04417 [Penicillium oxalicum 114-2]|uniref:Uncharacterized protein n=1 Tax=Penicillium oxalicum (strain 114-2 / CGMCC 5302) TaxID=933388 RepID=S8B4J1_PENO1|nr:hypothetical protein PDE_04417 [Penicillium oxalicum 114-2]
MSRWVSLQLTDSPRSEPFGMLLFGARVYFSKLEPHGHFSAQGEWLIGVWMSVPLTAYVASLRPLLEITVFSNAFPPFFQYRPRANDRWGGGGEAGGLKVRQIIQGEPGVRAWWSWARNSGEPPMGTEGRKE